MRAYRYFEVDIEAKSDPYGAGLGSYKIVRAKDRNEARRKANKWCREHEPTYRAYNVRLSDNAL